MKLRVLAIGQKMPDWVCAGYQDFAKRISGSLQVQLVELPMARRGKNDHPADLERHCQQEGDSILAALSPREQLIALEVGGRNLSTEQLSSTLSQWMNDGQDVALAIGGPDGLSPAVRARAVWHWSLSPLTLPHPLVRLVVIEQLYRAQSILQGHPYHRA